MTAPKPPPRLVDGTEAPPALRDALDAAHAYRPSPEQIAGLASALGGALDAPLPAAGGVLSPLLVKGIAGVAALGLLAGGAALYWGGRDPEPARARAREAVTEATPSTLARAPVPTEEAPPSTASSPPAVAEEPIAPRASATRPGVRAPAPEPLAAEGPTEAELLEAARRALRTDPGRALGLTVEHQRLHPRGLLGQEREVLAIEALSRIGRRGEARARAEQFLRRHPTSAHRERLESLAASP